MHLKRFLLFIYLVSTPLFAQNTDKEAPIHIEADRVEMHERDDLSIYKGNVKITKGSIRISGDKILIKNSDGKLDHIKVNGTPATFFQLNDLNEEISAQSIEMKYLAKNSMLELKQQALLVKNQNRFSSEYIIYDAHNDIVKAGNDNKTNSNEQPRVKITLHPERASESTNKTQPQ